MKRMMLALATAGFLLAIPASKALSGKGHVPIGKVQVCHAGGGTGAATGQALMVDDNALAAHLGHGDCQLPACDFNNVFFNGDACTRSAAAQCSLQNARDDAGGATPGCPAGTF